MIEWKLLMNRDSSESNVSLRTLSVTSDLSNSLKLISMAYHVAWAWKAQSYWLACFWDISEERERVLQPHMLYRYVQIWLREKERRESRGATTHFEAFKIMYEFHKSKAEALKTPSMRSRKHKAQTEKWEELKRLYPFTVFQRSCESHGFYYLREGTNLLNRLWRIFGGRKLFNQKEGGQN